MLVGSGPRDPGGLLLLLLLVTLYLVTTSVEAQDKPKRCLVNVEEVKPPRFFHVRGIEHVVTIGTSTRPAHRLLSWVFKIFLQEVLGYAKVKVIELDDFYDAKVALLKFHSPKNESGGNINHIPTAMINLELPLPPSIDLASHALSEAAVDDCGVIGPVGRFGWFVPTQLIRWSRLFQQQQPAPDHWRIFTRPEWAAMFDQNIAQLASFTRDSSTSEFYCKASYCTNGIHVPQQCQASRGKVKSCAVLLAGYPADTEFVVDQIARMELLVRVVWVGPHLKMITDQFAHEVESNANATSAGPLRGVVALSWHPSTLTATQRYTSISFPACEPSDPNNKWQCERLTSHRLVKVTWRRLDQKSVDGLPACIGGKAAYEAVHLVNFTVSNYEDMLKRYINAGDNADIEELACTWLKDNENISLPTSWQRWKPNADRERATIEIGGIFPMGGPLKSYTARGIAVAANMAIEAVNANSTVLRDYHLHLKVFNGQCNSDTVMRSFIEYIRDTNDYQKLAGILGPACSDTVEPLAGVSKHFNTIIISYSAEGSSFNDRTKYPYFFRTIGENKEYRNVYLQLLRKLNWGRVAALTEDGQKYTEYISHLQNLLHVNGISFIDNRKFPRDKESQDMKQYLKELNGKKAKIIIADVHDDIARTVMCEAYHLKMTGKHGYVWFLPLWLSRDWYNTDHYNKNSENINCTTVQMIEAINGHLSIAHAYFASDEEKMQESISVGEWKKKYEVECRKKKVPQSNYAGYAYDAVWTYAYALDKLIKTNQSRIASLHSSDSTKTFVKLIEGTDFNGVSGHISFPEGPSRVSLIHVVQWINNTTNIVGTYYPNSNGNSTGQLYLNESAIRWVTPEGKLPDDGAEPPPTCFVQPIADFFNTTCEIAIVIINLLGFGILGIILLLVFIFMKRRYEKMTEKYMRSMGIDLLPNATSLASLDKWEIAREHVVINRKLGEGAFGTVYGGEANFPEKGWVAVAVKTLKVGSNTEVKLDFLSEAEVMKRLDHQNIVRLLGVCTKSEPVYTVMEFMLYGDLKTFLLARRHLVTERSTEESEEISSKKLTNMALDVARALTYLADLKYVHRDVACRNCMVNANRVVKLGDFGMTRAMYESDYYKFNRKGMLPVRWMAPESLGLGIFTPQSDIWSYGVLLYEIITFGSFPFQGMSNSQVLEFVKNGNTLTIPKGVKSQLEGLLKSCWLPDHKKRPNASEVVEFLANNPRLIAPCLDMPLASVQMEDTGQLELQLPEKSRKCSVSLKGQRHRSLSGGSHAATTPNSPTSVEPCTKLARSATTQDVLQAIPLLPAPPNNARHASTSSDSPDTVPLLSTSVLATEVDLIKPTRSVTVPILLPPPPSKNSVEYIQENGGPLSPSRRLSGTLPLTKYVGLHPVGQRPKQQENGGIDYQATSVL